ncbi:MAG TPA: PepSY-associated TM helix domain-containing protein [Woeseiaceae bacterium]|nr:PepSY-associated TM helix domain-containing protein [Woeseiaceae bacterium]
MNRSSNGNSGNGRAKRTWARRVHRWLGLSVLLFVLLLSTTGIALNHTSAWRLDEIYVGWPWLLAAYGIDAPDPSASFAAGEHRVTLLGGRLYLDGRELARGFEALAGAAATEELLVIAAGAEVFLLTSAGELVERMDLSAALPAGISTVGLADGRVVVQSGDALFRFDESLVDLHAAPPTRASRVRWSTASTVPADELARIEDLYRGRGMTLERVLVDLHSGRIVTRFGAWLMDFVAVLLIVLSFTGLTMWRRRK